MENQFIKRAQEIADTLEPERKEVERHQREFVEHLEKLSKGKLMDYTGWFLPFSELPKAAISILGHTFGDLDETDDNLGDTKSIEDNKRRIRAVWEAAQQVNAILCFIDRELDVVEFARLAN